MTVSIDRGFSQIAVLMFLLLSVGIGMVLVQKQSNLVPTAQKDVTPKNYIVILNDEIDNPEQVTDELVATHQTIAKQKYSKAIKGFAANLSQSKLEKIKSDPRVKFVSQDREIKADAPPQRTPKPTSGGGSTGQVVPTGVKRIGANLNPNKGDGIGVAVIDTGIDLKHSDLRANIAADKSCVTGARSGQDDNGHGTHIAGTIAAINNSTGVVGVAPRAKLIAVKVLNSSATGSWSDVICGIDWVVANASLYNIKVVNMSLSGGGSSDNNCGNSNFDALHLAICRARDAGITFAVSAGNDGIDSSGVVPAAYDDAVITVSGLNDSDGISGGLGVSNNFGADDTFPNFNYGSVVDLGAPSVDILSTWLGGGYNTLTYTSMATPHVSAAAALYLKSNPGSTFAQVRDGLKTSGEILGQGHTDPSGLHPEPVVKASNL